MITQDEQIAVPDIMDTDAFNAGFSAITCRKCPTHVATSDEHPLMNLKYVECPNCGYEISIYRSNITVVPSSAHLVDIETAKDAVWYHSTYTENWLEEVLSASDIPLVHIGTKKTAWERAEYQMGGIPSNLFPDETMSLYEIRLKPEIVIGQEFLEDDNDWCPSVSLSPYSAPAMRYINKWEDTGSISMLVDPRFIEVTKVSILEYDGSQTYES